MEGSLKSNERQRLAKERREEREKSLGKLCPLAVEVQGTGAVAASFPKSLRNL